MRVIILEGPDGSGKSTLASQLEMRGYKILKFGVPPPEARESEETIFHFFYDRLYSAAQEPEAKIVCDRFHISDTIYGAIMRKEWVMTPDVQTILERYIEAIDGQIVMCIPPKRVALANWLSRQESEYVQDAGKISAVYNQYVNRLFNIRMNRNYIWYDYTRWNVTSVAKSLEKIEGNPLPAGMVGSQRPRFIFHVPGLPFDTVEVGSGYKKLTRKVFNAGFKEHEIAFCNTPVIPISKDYIEFVPTTIISEPLLKGNRELAQIRRNSR